MSSVSDPTTSPPPSYTPSLKVKADTYKLTFLKSADENNKIKIALEKDACYGRVWGAIVNFFTGSLLHIKSEKSDSNFYINKQDFLKKFALATLEQSEKKKIENEYLVFASKEANEALLNTPLNEDLVIGDKSSCPAKIADLFNQIQNKVAAKKDTLKNTIDERLKKEAAEIKEKTEKQAESLKLKEDENKKAALKKEQDAKKAILKRDADALMNKTPKNYTSEEIKKIYTCYVLNRDYPFNNVSVKINGNTTTINKFIDHHVYAYFDGNDNYDEFFVKTYFKSQDLNRSDMSFIVPIMQNKSLEAIDHLLSAKEQEFNNYLKNLNITIRELILVAKLSPGKLDDLELFSKANPGIKLPNLNPQKDISDLSKDLEASIFEKDKRDRTLHIIKLLKENPNNRLQLFQMLREFNTSAFKDQRNQIFESLTFYDLKELTKAYVKSSKQGDFFVDIIKKKNLSTEEKNELMEILINETPRFTKPLYNDNNYIGVSDKWGRLLKLIGALKSEHSDDQLNNLFTKYIVPLQNQKIQDYGYTNLRSNEALQIAAELVLLNLDKIKDLTIFSKAILKNILKICYTLNSGDLSHLNFAGQFKDPKKIAANFLAKYTPNKEDKDKAFNLIIEQLGDQIESMQNIMHHLPTDKDKARFAYFYLRSLLGQKDKINKLSKEQLVDIIKNINPVKFLKWNNKQLNKSSLLVKSLVIEKLFSIENDDQIRNTIHLIRNEASRFEGTDFKDALNNILSIDYELAFLTLEKHREIKALHSNV